MVCKNNLVNLIAFLSIICGCSRDDLAPYEDGAPENVIPLNSSKEITIGPRAANRDGSVGTGGDVLVSQVETSDSKKDNNNIKVESVETLGGVNPDSLDDFEDKNSNKSKDQKFEDSEFRSNWVTVEKKLATVSKDNKNKSDSVENSKKEPISKNEPTKKEKPKSQKLTFRPIDGKIISPFGNLDDDGISIEGVLGQEVLAFKSGKVKYIGNKKLPEYGNMIIIEHKGGLVSVYAYLQDILVKEGQIVEAGEKIGTVGKSGEGIKSPQLYFQLMKNEEPIDPVTYF